MKGLGGALPPLCMLKNALECMRACVCTVQPHYYVCECMRACVCTVQPHYYVDLVLDTDFLPSEMI